MIFPSSDNLTSTQKFSLVLLVMVILDLIIFYFGFKGTGSIGRAIAWICLILDILLFMFFTAIGYIPIGIVVVLVLIVIILGAWVIKGKGS
jgi:hypothetical protein